MIYTLNVEILSNLWLWYASIVRSYLLHYGYEDTLNVLDAATSNSVPPINVSQQNGFVEQDKLYALNQRKTLRQVSL